VVLRAVEAAVGRKEETERTRGTKVIICFEGVDYSGKTTHVWTLGQALGATTFKFPDRSTPSGVLIDEHLRGKWKAGRNHGTQDIAAEHHLDAMCFQALQLANRMEIAGDIFRAASNGDVILDRYWPSGVVYGGNDGLDEDYLFQLHHWLPQPDLFLLVDVDTVEVFQRMKTRGSAPDRYESAGMERIHNIISRYRMLWQTRALEHPERWHVIDGRKPKEEVASQVQAIVSAARHELKRVG
jgi:dTMP kinase